MQANDGEGKHEILMRDFRLADYDQVISLWSRCGLPFRPNGRDSRERIAAEIEGPSAIFLVAEERGKIVGTVLGTIDGRKGWINRLAIEPDHQRVGLGSRMVQEIEARFRRKGLEVFACLIEDHNPGSMRFFEGIGYKDDRTVHYYSKRRSEGS